MVSVGIVLSLSLCSQRDILGVGAEADCVLLAFTLNRRTHFIM